jgi:hypothetical protein
MRQNCTEVSGKTVAAACAENRLEMGFKLALKPFFKE